MIISELKIFNFRNLHSLHLHLHSKFNFIYGPNGSGKTSILEALYLLSCGHSFRSKEIGSIVQHGMDSSTVYSKTADNQTISIQKSCSDQTQIKINGLMCYTTSQLAYNLPCLVFYSEIFSIIDSGPSVRRSILDWGLFHVKHEYLTIWKEYKRILKHRSVLLRKNAPYKEVEPWDGQLVERANQLDTLRSDYFFKWSKEFSAVMSVLSENECSMEYYKGWDRKGTGSGLGEILKQSYEQDLQKKYTQYGAHQADIIIKTKEMKAKSTLSRGQQKIALIAMKLAQANLLENKNCLYLFDDIESELDHSHLNNLLNYLRDIKGQIIITNIKRIDLLGMENVREFHLAKGSIVEGV